MTSALRNFYFQTIAYIFTLVFNLVLVAILVFLSLTPFFGVILCNPFNHSFTLFHNLLSLFFHIPIRSVTNSNATASSIIISSVANKCVLFSTYWQKVTYLLVGSPVHSFAPFLSFLHLCAHTHTFARYYQLNELLM